MLTADLHAQALLKRIQHGYDLRLMQRTVGLAQQPDTGLVGMVGDDAVTGHPTQQVVQIVVCDRFKGQEMLSTSDIVLLALIELTVKSPPFDTTIVPKKDDLLLLGLNAYPII